MKIANNIKLTMVCICAAIFTFISYALLPLTVDILAGRDLLTLFVGFIIVPLGICFYLSGVFFSISLIVSGIFNKNKIWWILGIILVIANIGTIIFAFI